MMKNKASEGKEHQPLKGYKKYVHITGLRLNTLIEFDFAISDPLLYVELALPIEQFQEFCAKNEVTFLNPEQVEAVEYDRKKWRYGSPGADDAS